MKGDRAYLMHIRDAAERILAYTESGKVAFLADSKTQDAVIRNLEIIGEAAKNVSVGMKSAHLDIPWRKMVGMRDKLIHGYFGVNLDLVWETILREVPLLQSGIAAILAENGWP